MIVQLNIEGKNCTADLSKPIDLSIPITPNEVGVNCFYAPQVKAEPVRAGNFVGSIEEGGILNFKNLHINPHGNGTHTESLAHISMEGKSIHQTLKQFHFIGRLITVDPINQNGDRVITKALLQDEIGSHSSGEALLIRSLPNSEAKKKRNYSGSNPPYFEAEAIRWLKEIGIQHLLTDLPSVDREEDGGKLLAHKAFWGFPDNLRKEDTITELIYVPNHVVDGLYLVNIQIMSLELDASPSKILIFPIK